MALVDTFKKTPEIFCYLLISVHNPPRLKSGLDLSFCELWGSQTSRFGIHHILEKSYHGIKEKDLAAVSGAE